MFLDSNDKKECFGCEACEQICPRKAITMNGDDEGFRYPIIDDSLCIDCGLCRSICPNMQQSYEMHKPQYLFGGYNRDESVRFNSTSGGAFSAIANAFCDYNYVIFGAKAEGLKVIHSYVTDINDIDIFRKSKYSQSIIGDSYSETKSFLLEGKKVLFSGTPCQIAGLKSFLSRGKVDTQQLLTVEVICEGVPSPLYIEKFNEYIEKRYGVGIEDIDYRYSGKGILSPWKWDFQQMYIKLNDGRTKVRDRWFNPFWSIWLQHLMSRPSCYSCQFACETRAADITLGDLWGVHLYCPELYGKNGGVSLVCCNTHKGIEVFSTAITEMYGHELKLEDAIKYQSPMRKSIEYNPKRFEFMLDLMNKDYSYTIINKKWAIQPTIKLLFEKYIYGNRQKIFIWNLKRKIESLKGKRNA